MKGWSVLGIMSWGAIASSCQLGTMLDKTPVLPTTHTNPSVRVMRVVSGNTLEIQPLNSPSALNQTIRLIGIQSPDMDQSPWGEDAHAHLERLVLGQVVTLSSTAEPVDSYGRSLAYVWLEDQLINQSLLEEGRVLVEERSPNPLYANQFRHAQHRARLLGLGLWNPDRPMHQTPQEFRQYQNSP